MSSPWHALLVGLVMMMGTVLEMMHPKHMRYKKYSWAFLTILVFLCMLAHKAHARLIAMLTDARAVIMYSTAVLTRTSSTESGTRFSKSVPSSVGIGRKGCTQSPLNSLSSSNRALPSA